jgi:dTDP-4-amino-4,6-dideoxygalactose transaminase
MTTTAPRAKYGAAAYKDFKGALPNPFPRVIGPNAMKYLQQVVDAGLSIDMTGRFEEAFAKAMGVKHCISAPGCTNALMLLAEALNFNPGDEVIVSPLADYGTIMGVVKRNCIPLFADTDPGSPNLSSRTIEPLITDRTRAIICVHKTGLMCDMDPIMALAKRRNLVVVEDACQAVYSRYKGRLAGTIGHVGAFSFDSEKTMGSDVGGCMITNDDRIADYARFIGQSRGAEAKAGFGRLHTVAGHALRMPNCTAAICLAQLEIIEEQVTHIDRMARLLTKQLAAIPGITPTPIPAWQDVYSCWMAALSIDPKQFKVDADQFAQQCADDGLTGAGTGRYYLMPAACTFLQQNAQMKTYPYSMPPASREYRYNADNCPNAKALLENWIRWSTICAKWQPEHVEICAEIVRRVAGRNRA